MDLEADIFKDTDFLASVAYQSISGLLHDMDTEEDAMLASWQMASVVVPRMLLVPGQLLGLIDAMERRHGVKYHLKDVNSCLVEVTFTGTTPSVCCQQLNALVSKRMAGFLPADLALKPEVSAPAPLQCASSSACLFIQHDNVHNDGRIALSALLNISVETRMRLCFRELKQHLLQGRSVESAVGVGLISCRQEHYWREVGVEPVAMRPRFSGNVPDNELYTRIVTLLSAPRKPSHLILACPRRTFYAPSDNKTYEAACVQAIQMGWTVEVCGWKHALPESFFLLSSCSNGRMTVRLLDPITQFVVKVSEVPEEPATFAKSRIFLRTMGCATSSSSSLSPAPPTRLPPGISCSYASTMSRVSSTPSPPLPPLPPLIPVALPKVSVYTPVPVRYLPQW